MFSTLSFIPQTKIEDKINIKKVIIELLYFDIIAFMFWSLITIFWFMEFNKSNLILILFVNLYLILVYKVMRLKLGFKEHCLLM